jgi:hypothetical protein
MTAVGHDVKFAFSDRGIQLSRMRAPWTRGATSGALLVILGAWAALAPFIGPYFDFAYAPATDTTGYWTAARGWLEVVPGAAAFAGGLLLVGSTNRAVTIVGSWLGIAGSARLIVGPSLIDVLNITIGTPDPALTTRRRAPRGVGVLLRRRGADPLLCRRGAWAAVSTESSRRSNRRTAGRPGGDRRGLGARCRRHPILAGYGRHRVYGSRGRPISAPVGVAADIFADRGQQRVAARSRTQRAAEPVGAGFAEGRFLYRSWGD